MYFHDDGVRQSYDMARQWYEKAAEQGNALAQFNLILLEMSGMFLICEAHS